MKGLGRQLENAGPSEATYPAYEWPIDFEVMAFCCFSCKRHHQESSGEHSSSCSTAQRLRRFAHVPTVEQILGLYLGPRRQSLQVPTPTLSLSPQQGSSSWACKKHAFPGTFTVIGGSLANAPQGIGMLQKVPSSSSCKFMEDSARWHVITAHLLVL